VFQDGLSRACVRLSFDVKLFGQGVIRVKDGKWLWLLLVPVVALAFPVLYSHASPELLGFPFFYWYQFAWVPLTALITGIVYWKTR